MDRISIGRLVPAAALALLGAAVSPAGADGVHLSAELPAALPIDAPQTQRFGYGMMPSIGVFISPIPGVDTGVRGRAGALSDRAEMDETLRDVGVGGFAGGALAVRARPGRWIGLPGLGGWIEVAGGAAITGPELRPSYEVAMGWRVDLGRFSAGPAARYLYIAGLGDSLDPRGAHLALLGIDLGFVADNGRSQSLDVGLVTARAPVVVPPRSVQPVARARPAVLVVTADIDRLIDVEEPCPLAVPDADEGCSLPDDVVVHFDRITLAERVLFDLNRARVKSRGQQALQQIAAAWHTHPYWTAMRIEGHADERGPERYNQELSELRAARVFAALVELGVPAEALSSEGFGSSQPLDEGGSPEALDRNRRVEFVIEWGPKPRELP
ncbi:MAG TPA: OmpA family protein [Kofleriaceae bacterium]|nr:OmpA family protein [Kofleriaceae bacterium]